MVNKAYEWLYDCIGNDKDNFYEKTTTTMIKDCGWCKAYKTIWQTSIAINIFLFFAVEGHNIDMYYQIIKSKDSATNVIFIKRFRKLENDEKKDTIYCQEFYLGDVGNALKNSGFDIDGIYNANDLSNDLKGYFSL